MSTINQWRPKFIELAEGIFRELGYPPPPVAHDEDAPLALELEVGGVMFEVVHAENDERGEILIECKFGAIPQDKSTAVLTRLLQVNLALARLHEATFGADPETNAVVYVFAETLDDARPTALMEEMERIAGYAKQWRQTFFMEDPAPPTPASGILGVSA